jgi:hypothetical protein
MDSIVVNAIGDPGEIGLAPEKLARQDWQVFAAN